MSIQDSEPRMSLQDNVDTTGESVNSLMGSLSDEEMAFEAASKYRLEVEFRFIFVNCVE
jgi:hypothetical protein